MNVKIKNSAGETIIDGEYLYTEGAIVKGIPSFHITVRDPARDEFNIYFIMKDIGELSTLIDDIKDIKTINRD